MIDRVTALIPLPGMSRTAADTSFGDEQAAENRAAEQALADLEDRVRQQGGTDGSTDPIDPATVDAVGPPIPAFKPALMETTRSLSAEAPASSIDQAQLASNEGVADAGDEDGEPSIFEQLWQFLRPG